MRPPAKPGAKLCFCGCQDHGTGTSACWLLLKMNSARLTCNTSQHQARTGFITTLSNPFFDTQRRVNAIRRATG